MHAPPTITTYAQELSDVAPEAPALGPGNRGSASHSCSVPALAWMEIRVAYGARKRNEETVKVNPLKHRRPTAPLQGAFGQDRFGRGAEAFARTFGTPGFLIVQTLVVAAWIALNAGQLLFKPFDPYPYILLNLAFSTQAAYAAPLILLAQTRQADRDKAHMETDVRHREEVAQYHIELLQQNTELTERVAQLTDQVADLTREIHDRVVQKA